MVTAPQAVRNSVLDERRRYRKLAGAMWQYSRHPADWDRGPAWKAPQGETRVFRPSGHFLDARDPGTSIV